MDKGTKTSNFLSASSKIRSCQVIKFYAKLQLSLIFAVLLFILISPTIPANDSILYPPEQQDPEVIIELETYETKVDTSPGEADPMIEVDGTVTLLSQHPFVSINISIDETVLIWNCSVEPTNFNLTTVPVSYIAQDIKVTVHAPAGEENGTQKVVTVKGTWSYIPEIPGIPAPDPVTGEIPPVTLTVETKNETENGKPNNGNGNGNGNGGGNDDDEFQMGFEIPLVIAVVVIVIIIVVFAKRRDKKQKDEDDEDEDD
jgi:hypothetical protein